MREFIFLSAGRAPIQGVAAVVRTTPAHGRERRQEEIFL